MVLAHDVDLVIERTPSNGGLDDVVARLVRDLEVTSALCTSESGGRRQLLAWAGIDPMPFLRSIRLVEAPAAGCCSQVSATPDALKSAGIGAYVAVPIDIDDGSIAGVLWAADSTRRWFDHDELRHLQLLAQRASTLLLPPLTIGLDEPSVPEPDRVLSLSRR